MKSENEDGVGKTGFSVEGKEWRWPGIFYTDTFLFCGESEDDLSVMIGRLLLYTEGGV